MASILDVLFSIILGGLLMVTMLGANDVALENSTTLHGDQMVQESAVDLAMYMDGQLRNIGFGVADTLLNVVRADSTTVIYCTSLPPFTKVDTMKFYLGPTSDLAATPNEMDRYVYQQQDGGTAVPIGVVTYLRFRYYNRSDSLMAAPVPASQLTQVFKVEVTTEVQNSYAPYRQQSMVQQGQENALYSGFLWSQTRLTSQNIRVAARPAQQPKKSGQQGGEGKDDGPSKPGPNRENPNENQKPQPAPGPGPRPPQTPPPPDPPPPPVVGVN